MFSPYFLWSIAVCCKSQNLIFSLDKARINVTNSQTVRVYSNPMLIVSKMVFIYGTNPYLGNSACAFIAFQSMYHRSSSHSFIISLLTADRYSQHFHTKPWFQMVYLSSICLSISPSIHQAVYSICNITMMSPHALKQVYSCVLLNVQ